MKEHRAREVERAAAGPLWLLLVPIAIVVATYPGLLYTAPGTIDPWVYLGYMRHFGAFKGELFPSTYYGSRLSWLLPGVLAHRVLPAVAANAVLHMAVLLTAIGSLYFILARTVSRRAALLTAMCAGAYPYWWTSAGWDYVDGVGIAYYLLTMALLIAAARAPRPALLLFGAGIAYAALVYSNIAWTFFSASFPAAYWYWLPEDRRKAWRREAARFVVACAAGSALVTVVFEVINRSVEHTLFFYGPSVSYSLSTVGQANPWKAPNYRWSYTAYWLALPAAAVIASAWVVARNWRKSRGTADAPGRMTVFFAWNLLYTAGILSYMEFVLARPALELWYYASYATPATFLALGPAFLEGAENWKQSRFRAAWISAILLAVAIWGGARLFPTPIAQGAQAWTEHGLGIVSLAAAARFVRRRAFLPLAFVGVLLIDAQPWGDPFFTGVHNRPEAFRRIVAASDAVERNRGGRIVRFWYSTSEPFSEEFNAINACYLWGYTWVGLNYPKPPDRPIESGALLVLPSSDRDAARNAAAVLEAHAAPVRLLGTERIEDSGKGFYMNFFEVGKKGAPNGR